MSIRVLAGLLALPSVAFAAAACGNDSFPLDLNGKQAFGLRAARGAHSAAECVRACCNATTACGAWQWWGQEARCFIGQPTKVRVTSDSSFSGGMVVPPSPAPTPPVPPAPTPPPTPPQLPSADQLAWLDLEMGTFFHFTMYTFVSQPNPVTARHQDCGAVFNADLAAMPHPSVFNPSNASTMVDQWMEASKAMGARYAILVAKHCDGFVSFPTNATFADGSPYGYGVQQSSWRGGRGDLARDFVESARKHGISPGFYYSLDGNFYLSVADGKPTPATAAGQRPATTAEYYDIVLTQLAELWGNYGQLGEIWFDGKNPFVQNATLQAAVAALAGRLQPHALLMQGPSATNAGRKGDGETCEVHDPNWYTCPNSTACRSTLGGQGPFIPAEGAGCAVGDGDSRQWFWHPDHDEHAALKTVGMFVDEYHKSVGLGSNMLVGLTADRQGLVPDVDVAKISALGDFVRRCYRSPLAVTNGSHTLRGPSDHIDLAVPQGAEGRIHMDRVWLREDMRNYGQRAQEFQVFASGDGGATFSRIGNGTSIARKRIVLLDSPMAIDILRFQVTKALEWPLVIQEAAAFKQALC